MGGSVADIGFEPSAGRWHRALFVESSVAMAVVDLEGRIIRANHAMADLLGYSIAELEAGINFAQVTHPDDLQGDQRMFDAVVVTRKYDSYSMAKRYLTRHGRIIPAHLAVRAVVDESGKVECVVGTVVPLPNHGHYKVQEGEKEIIVRSVVKLSDLYKDNWKALTPIVGGLLAWGISVLYEALKALTN